MTGFGPNPRRRYEGWDDSTDDPDTVRRFAVPPYRWVTVDKAEHAEAWRRHAPAEFDRRCSSA